MIGCGRRKVLVTENLLSEFYDCHEQGEVGSGVKRDLDLEREEDSEEKSTAQMRLFFLSHWPYLVFISLAHIYLEFVTETAGKIQNVHSDSECRAHFCLDSLLQ